MTMIEFIDTNRKELKGIVAEMLNTNLYLDDEELENWIMNDEGLYLWAIGDGVDI